MGAGLFSQLMIWQERKLKVKCVNLSAQNTDWNTWKHQHKIQPELLWNFTFEFFYVMPQISICWVWCGFTCYPLCLVLLNLPVSFCVVCFWTKCFILCFLLLDLHVSRCFFPAVMEKTETNDRFTRSPCVYVTHLWNIPIFRTPGVVYTFGRKGRSPGPTGIQTPDRLADNLITILTEVSWLLFIYKCAKHKWSQHCICAQAYCCVLTVFCG